MKKKLCANLPNELHSISDSDYKKLWNQLGPIEIKMIKKYEPCRHKVREKHYYKHPYERPRGVCTALLNVIDLYTWRVALGFPSWERDDRSVFRIHCPADKGTVWEVRKVKKVKGKFVKAS